MSKQDSGVEARRHLEIFFTLLATAAVLFAVVRMAQNAKQKTGDSDVQPVTGWYLQEGDREIPVEPGDTLEFGADGSVSVSVRGLPGGTVTTRAGLYRVKITLDGQEVYRFDDSAFPYNDQMRAKVHCDAPVTPGGVLTITYYQDNAPAMVMPEVYFGSSSSVLLSHIRGDTFTLVLVVVMLLCTIVSLVAALSLSGNRMLDDRVLDLAAFLVLSSIWCYCDSALGRYISHMSPIVESISFCAFMLLGIPAALFAKNTVTGNGKKSIELLIYGFNLNILVQILLWSAGAADFIQMLPVTHLLLAVGFGLCMLQLYREWKCSGNSQFRMVLMAFGAVGASGVFAETVYWMFDLSFYETFFEMGLLVFILLLTVYLSMAVAESLRFKAESKIYARLSREDSMTGLQNRRSFDEFIQELELKRQEGTNAVLFFLDINGLKKVNDRYGHKAGDEMIIGAARCLQKAFGPDVNVFRLGGDEFCVIASDVEKVAHWREKLNRELEIYNQCHPIGISMAAGKCTLLDEQGKARRISDWKHLADQQMYENKQEMKQRVL